MSRHTYYKWDHIPTLDASIRHHQELLVPARVAEEAGVDGQGTFLSSCACAVHREVDVDIAVSRERDVAVCRHDRVVPSVAGRLEQDDLVVGTRDLEDRVETSVILVKFLTPCSNI